MKKKRICTALLGLLLLAGCGNTTGGPAETPVLTETPTPTPFVPEIIGVFEAEEAKLNGNVKVTNNYVEGFQQAETDSCAFTVTVDKEGFYDLVFRIASTGGEKTNPVSVDGTAVGNIYTNATYYQESSIERVWFSVGEHAVSVGVSWGWILLDKMTVQTSAPLPDDL